MFKLLLNKKKGGGVQLFVTTKAKLVRRVLMPKGKRFYSDAVPSWRMGAPCLKAHLLHKTQTKPTILSKTRTKGSTQSSCSSK